jgi:hypothetical protein
MRHCWQTNWPLGSRKAFLKIPGCKLAILVRLAWEQTGGNENLGEDGSPAIMKLGKGPPLLYGSFDPIRGRDLQDSREAEGQCGEQTSSTLANPNASSMTIRLEGLEQPLESKLLFYLKNYRFSYTCTLRASQLPLIASHQVGFCSEAFCAERSVS